MNNKTEVDSFTIGGTAAGPSMPGRKIHAMLGTRIAIDVHMHVLHVPTPRGYVTARIGDRIILYDDGTLEVRLA